MKVQLKNDIKLIDEVWIQWKGYCQETSVPEEIMHDLRLVLEEFLVNIIHYGYRDDDEHIIDVCIHLEHGDVVISIEDDGEAFNPLDYTKVPESPSDGIGGYGIHICRQLTDDMTYKRSNGRNQLRLIRKTDSEIVETKEDIKQSSQSKKDIESLGIAFEPLSEDSVEIQLKGSVDSATSMDLES